MAHKDLPASVRVKLAVMRIEAKRREGFDKNLRANPAPTVNVDTSANGPWYRNTKPVVGRGKSAMSSLD